MVQEVISTIILQLLVLSSFTEATTFDNDDFGVGRGHGYEPDPERTSVNEQTRPITLNDILNQRVSSTEDLCPTADVLMFFSTGNLEYLRNCYLRAVNRNNQTNPVSAHDSSTSSSSSQSRRAPEFTSYSGRLLKRILQNIDDVPSVDNLRARGQHRPRTAEKRARLSINGALSSLADMLRYEAAQPRGHKYAFHEDLLHMG